MPHFATTQAKGPRQSATSFTAMRGGWLQRKCACGSPLGPTGECEKCRKNRESKNDQFSEIPPIVHEVLNSPGEPVDPATRAFMEPRFGHDFRNVRVHTDAKAAESTRAVQAHAYTVGKDVVFGENRYAPTTHTGRDLLAHELAHTIQQRGGGSEPSGHERVREGEANRAASQALSGRAVAPLTRSGLAVARQPSDDKPSSEWIDGQIALVHQQLQMPLLPPPMKATLLLRLKELETLEKVTEKIDKISVFGGLEGVLKDLVKIRP